MTSNGAVFAQEPKIRAIFATIPAEVAQKGGLKSIETVSSEVKGDTATVRLRIHYNNGSSQLDSSKLVRVDGKWKIIIE